MNSYINSFLEYLTLELGYSSKTAKTYNEALKEYEIYLEKQHFYFLKINKDIANGYKAYLVKKNYESKTASLYLSSVRSFYNYLVEINAIKANPFLMIKNPKIIKKLPIFLNHSESDILFNNDILNNDLAIRDKFIIEFLYATGLRVSELCSIKLQDIDFNDKKIRVMGKGSKERIVFYKACREELFNQYVYGIRQNILNGVKSDYLIVSKTGKLTSRRIEEIVHRYAVNKNIKSKITPHTLRHTFATDLLNEGADIRSVGEMLGHESLSTTQIYTHVTVDKLKKIYEQTHPRSRK